MKEGSWIYLHIGNPHKRHGSSSVGSVAVIRLAAPTAVSQAPATEHNDGENFQKYVQRFTAWKRLSVERRCISPADKSHAPAKAL